MEIENGQIEIRVLDKIEDYDSCHQHTAIIQGELTVTRIKLEVDGRWPIRVRDCDQIWTRAKEHITVVTLTEYCSAYSLLRGLLLSFAQGGVAVCAIVSQQTRMDSLMYLCV